MGGRTLKEQQLNEENLLAGLSLILDKIEEEQIVFIVKASKPDWRGNTAFVIGPQSICGLVLGLAGDPEYGWPVNVDAGKVNSIRDISPGNRRHQFITRDGKCVAVVVQLCEYETIKKLIKEKHLEINQAKDGQASMGATVLAGGQVDQAALRQAEQAVSFERRWAMSGKVKLETMEGPMKGKTFLFEEHDTFIFGRSPIADGHAYLPDDLQVSRHHFILEVNPPDARIRDLGSRNGTYVNGVKYGGREEGETPEEGRKRAYPEVNLKNGDRIQVGQTTILLQVEIPAVCCECNCEIPDADRDKCSWIGGTFICVPCKAKLAASMQPAKKPEPVRCQKCNKDVSSEVGQGQRGSYICEVCRKKVDIDPARLLFEILRQAGIQAGGADAPQIVGYEIEKEIDRGGFGAVYLARRKKDGQRAAVKVMLADVAVNEKARSDFSREMDVCYNLRHRNIVEYVDRGSAGPTFYFIMEFCDGGDAAGLMKRSGGRIPLAQAAPIMLQTLDGLAFAHEKGIIHRDLKPKNILLCGSGASLTAKVSDFGLAKKFQDAGLTKSGTVTGAAAGTPFFMPREQVTNFKYVKPPTDVWSIAATFYNMLTGLYPHNFRPKQDNIAEILNGKIVSIRQRDSNIPAELAGVIDRALSNDVKARYQDAGEMLKALNQAL